MQLISTLEKIGPGVFRLLLALTVVLFHTTKLVGLGTWAVYVFFILSGYWIIKMYNEKYMKLKRPVITFYLSRILRLLPVFYINLLIFVIIVLLINDPVYLKSFIKWIKDPIFLFSHAFMLGLNFSDSCLIKPSWSLDIELQFYLLTPIIVYLLIRKKNIQFDIAFILLLAVIFLTHFFINFYINIVFYLFFFFVGYMIYKYDFKSSSRLLKLTLCLFFVIILLTYVVPELYQGTVRSAKLKILDFYLRDLVDFILALLIIPFTSHNLKSKSNSFDKVSGNLSYIMYLFHWVMLYPYIYYFRNLSFTEKIPYFILFILITVLGSLIIYYLIDQPFEAIRRKWLLRRETSFKN